jgi:hypothetical protein
VSGSGIAQSGVRESTDHDDDVRDLAKKFELNLPDYEGIDQVVQLANGTGSKA